MNLLIVPFAVMGLILFCIFGIILFLNKILWDVFQHNIYLNSLISLLFVFGISSSFWHMLCLKKDMVWFKTFFHKNQNSRISLFLLTPIESVRHKVDSLTLDDIHLLTQTLYESSEEKRSMNRYFIGLSVFLGLVGTFWGLSKTITSIAEIINSLDVNATDLNDAFSNLKNCLQKPIVGMGYAFSSSLFGLSISLFLGIIDLTLHKTYFRFIQSIQYALFNYVSTHTSSKAPSPHGQTYLNVVVEKLAENLEQLSQKMIQSETNHTQFLRQVQTLTQNIQSIEQTLKHSYTQDEAFKNSMKSIENTLKLIHQEGISGREYLLRNLSSEIRLITKTLSFLAQETSDNN